LFALDAKTIARIAPTVSRIVILDPNPAPARLLADLLKGIGAREVVIESAEDRAFQSIRDLEPGLVFTERTGAKVDGESFVRRLRKSSLACRRVPVIMVTSEATATSIKGARDAGVHEFLRKPFTANDLFRRVENVALKPRDWIEGMTYIGPDRRRFNSGEYAGPRKRKHDEPVAGPAAIKDQAMRILAAALNQFDNDPSQAIRSAARQAETLKALAGKTGDVNMAAAATRLEMLLANGPVTRSMLAGPVQALLAMADPAAPQARAG
jgi:CheY-like chemotaxis protein